MNFSRIFLTGFMTSGKSTLGPILANVYGWNFYDLDKVIEDEEKMSVVEIFENKGEKYFRQKEHETLKKIIEKENIVVALGGGTIVNDSNLHLMKHTGKVIYLKVSPEVLYQRLKHKIDRPLFRDLVLGENSSEDFIDRIKIMLVEREVFYLQSDLVIDSDSNQVGFTVDQLAKKISRL